MHTHLTPRDALLLAIGRAGGQKKLAEICGFSTTTVWNWRHRGDKVTAEAVLKIEAATGVSRHDLRPDLYPRESAPPAPAAQDAA